MGLKPIPAAITFSPDVSGIASGIDHYEVSGTDLIIYPVSGSPLTMHFTEPVGIASITAAGDELTVTYTDGTDDTFTIPTIKGDKGDPGEDGEKGDKGDKGDTGAKGDKGDTPVIEAGDVETVPYGSPAVVTMTQTPTGARVNFKIPQGKPGEGGSGGTSDYDELTNKPKIEGHTLNSGNQTAESLGLASEAVTDALDTRVTALEENPVNPFQFDTMPEAGDHPQEVVEYIGATTGTYTRGYFYRSTPIVVEGSLSYVWQQIDTQPSNRNYEDLSNHPQINGVELTGDKMSSDLSLQDTIQYSELPEASASLLGKVYQYVGANTATRKTGYYYRCIYDNTAYVWVQMDTSDNTALADRVSTLETNQGNMANLEVTGVSDLVAALNKVNAKAIDRYAYIEPNLIIYYRDGSTVQISVGDILSETQIGELANVLDGTIQDGNVLQYDAGLQKYKPYAILAALQNLLTTSKDYTDQQISSAIVAGAYVCDEKPSYDAEHDTVVYKQNGELKTTTQTDARFYYYSDGDPYCTSWIDDIEFTFSVADVDFEDYVNKNTDVVSHYTEGMLDKAKIPDVGAMDDLMGITKTMLASKINKVDIIDTLTSSDASKPLSARQGKVLKDAVDTKNDILQYATMPIADQPYLGKVAQYVGTTGGAYTKGFFYVCKYESTSEVYYWENIKYSADTDAQLDPTSTNPVQNSVITAALDEKQPKILSFPVMSQTTVEAALHSIETADSEKQPKVLTMAIAGKNTVVEALKAIDDKAVDADGATIVKDPSTGELHAVTATTNTKGVVQGHSGDTEIDENGGVKVLNRLMETSALPTASASNEGKVYLLTGTQSGYVTGNIYKCVSDGETPATYSWAVVNKADIDLSNYVQKSQTAGLLKSDGTVDTTQYLSSAVVDGKADKISSPTNNNLVSMDANGNIKDSGVSASDFLGSTAAADRIVTSHWISSDFNDAIPSDNESMKVFTVLNSALNTPKTGTNYIVIAIAFSSGLIQQEAIQNGTNDRYTRYLSGGAWSSWNRLQTSTIPSASDNLASLDANGNLADSGVPSSSGGCAHGNTDMRLTSNTILAYLRGLSSSIKFATFRVASAEATVSDRVDSSYWYAYTCVRDSDDDWSITAIRLSTSSPAMYIGIVQQSTTAIQWDKLVTDEIVPSTASSSNKLVTESDLDWTLMGQGISNDYETATITINLSGKKDVMFVFRTTSNSTENLGTCVVPASLLSTNTMFRQGYITYDADNNGKYARYTVVSRSSGNVGIALTTNKSGSEIAVYAR